MLDLIEGSKIVVGLSPTTANVTSADWINTENMHTVWAIVTKSVGAGSASFFSAQVGESYAGASASTPTATYWATSGLNNLDRLRASTQSTGLTAASSKGMVVIKYDPSVSDTSDHYFSVSMTSGLDVAVTYICEPRYGGYQQFIATTSST